MASFPTGPAITLVNRSTVVSDDELAPVAAAIQRQLEEHFAPSWGFTASIITTPSTDTAPDWAWWIVLLDDTEQAGTLGYHDLTATGRPMSKVFARTTQQYRIPWSAIASHEALEMLADPGVNLAAYRWGDSNGYLYAIECCDPVGGLFYEIDGVRVSNFVFPAWYQMFDPDNDGPWDFLNACRGPFSLALGGFQIYVVWGTSGWEFAARGAAVLPGTTDPPEGSRRERRIRGQQNWVLSEGR